jgi:hypothetical protein
MLILTKRGIVPAIILLLSASVFSCGSDEPKTAESKDISTIRALEHDELVQRGQYIVSTSGCNDCHSPKVFDASGMHVDSTKPLSGSPADLQLPPISASALKPGNWVLMAPNVTAFVGPWGVSYAANLTPDSTTGLGTWSREMFIKTLRTGKHMGLEGGRPIMPPMPWYEFAKMTDEDLSAIFAYLQSLTPVNNKVKDYVSPPEAAKLVQ